MVFRNKMDFGPAEIHNNTPLEPTFLNKYVQTTDFIDFQNQKKIFICYNL